MIKIFKKEVEKNGDFKELFKYKKEMNFLAKYPNQKKKIDDIDSWDITLLTSYLKECSLCELCHPNPVPVELETCIKAGANSEAQKAGSQKWKLSERQLQGYKDWCTGRVKYVHENDKYKNFVKAVKLTGKDDEFITLIPIQSIPSPGDAKLFLSVVTREWHIINDIREIRNTKYHDSVRLTKEEFDKIYEVFMEMYKDMEWDKQKIQEIKDCKLYPNHHWSNYVGKMNFLLWQNLLCDNMTPNTRLLKAILTL